MTLLDQLQALAPLAEQADTAAPWAFAPAHDYDGWVVVREIDLELHHSGTALDFASIAEINDAAFIAAARNLLTPENLALLIAALAASPCEVCHGTGRLEDDGAWDEPGTADRCSKCPYCAKNTANS